MDLAQVGESTLGKGSNKVQCGSRRVVALNHTIRVGASSFRSEVVAIDDVTTVGRQSNVTARFGVARAGLGKLTGHAAHLDDGHLCCVCEHDSHLQNRLHAVANLVCGGTSEGLGAISALQ